MGAASSVADGDADAERDVEQRAGDDLRSEHDGEVDVVEAGSGGFELRDNDCPNESEENACRSSDERSHSESDAPAPQQEPHFESTDELFGQWNMPCISAMITCEKDFVFQKRGSGDAEDIMMQPPSAVVLDGRLEALLRRICKLHAATHTVQLNAERDAGSLRSGKKSMAAANPIKILLRRVTEIENLMHRSLAIIGDEPSASKDSNHNSVDDSDFATAASTESVQKRWQYPSPLQFPDSELSLGGSIEVSGFAVRLSGAAGCLVAVEALRNHGLAGIMEQATTCSGIGAHPNILMLICARRKMLWRDAAAAAGDQERAVELTWEYVKGYTLEKLIISGGLYLPAHRPSPALDGPLRR
jgi:hypothetical protein